MFRIDLAKVFLLSLRVEDWSGHEVILTEERLAHIKYRHPEVDISLVLETVREPDEVYIDARGCFHALKKVHKPTDFLVVIYCVLEGIGFIKTAYYIGRERKKRRYGWFRRLLP